MASKEVGIRDWVVITGADWASTYATSGYENRRPFTVSAVGNSAALSPGSAQRRWQ